MELERIRKAVSDCAESLGVAEYEVFYSSKAETSTETLNNKISNFSSSASGGISVRVLHGGKMGYASSELITEEELCELVKTAVKNAEYTERADEVGLFSGSDSYSEKRNPDFLKKGSAELSKIAQDIAGEAYAASPMIKDGTGTLAGSTEFSMFIFNSKGLMLTNKGGFDYAYCEAIAENDGEYQSGFSMKKITKPTDASSIANEGVNDAIQRLGAKTVPTGRYNVIIDGERMRYLLSAFSPAFSAKNAQLGTSLLKNKEGQRIASDAITITDDPMREELGVGTYFDAEGVSAERKTVVEKGVLKTLLHNRETAKKAGVTTTANASRGGYSSPVGISPYAFCIERSELSEEQLLEMANDGIYVTELKGLHAGANAITGDFSIESSGFLIENGKKCRAVKSFTISGNFFELLMKVEAVGGEIKFGLPGIFTSFGSPSVLIKDMSVAGE